MTSTNNNNDINNEIDKITGFFTDKVDDAKYQLEARQRKFEISAAGSKLDRKKAKVQNWFDNKVVARVEEHKEGIQKLTGDQQTNKNQNENKFRRVGEGDLDGCDATNFDCSNPCGLFST
mmetsp:Transcript_6031/g.14619  ORF Transcript_6031/g.14619 Transcript_6031/m.14619 type:complete len:120 (-) Transcript_6031:1862-2221(-)